MLHQASLQSRLHGLHLEQDLTLGVQKLCNGLFSLILHLLLTFTFKLGEKMRLSGLSRTRVAIDIVLRSWLTQKVYFLAGTILNLFWSVIVFNLTGRSVGLRQQHVLLLGIKSR